MALNPKKILPFLLVAALLGTATLVWMRARGNQHPGELKISGNIEVTRTEVSFKVAGRLAERLVSEGEMVKKGQVLARLDPADLDREVGLREAELRAARAALSLLRAGSRPEEIAQAASAEAEAQARLDALAAGARPQEITAAEAAASAARSSLEEVGTAVAFARSENERAERLFGSGFVSEREREAAKTGMDSALAKERTARDRLAEAEARLALLRAGTRSEEIAQARAALSRAAERRIQLEHGARVEEIEEVRARVAGAEESLKLAQTRRGYAEAVSPLDGLCLTHSAEPGEYVNAGTPVVTVADMANAWLRGYVDETDLGLIAMGHTVDVTADTWPGRVFPGKVSFISSEAEFTPRSVQTEKERVKLVYRVKITVDNPTMELKPGMPVEGLIRLSSP